MADKQFIRCSACSAVNRVPIDKLQQGLEPICGNCKSTLPVKKPFVVTDATFASDVEQSTLPVLVDMWAEWCGPCRAVSPILDQIAQEMTGRLRIAKMNIDENQVTPSRFSIQSIPAMLLFKNGREVDRIVGALPKPEIVRRLQAALN